MLLVTPNMIFDQSVVVGGSLKFEGDRNWTKAFLRSEVGGTSQFFNITWIGIFREAYLGIGASPSEVSNSGLYGSAFCLPGNGYLYVAHKVHHTPGDKYYVRKYEIVGDSLKPTSQALTYLNLESKVNKSIAFFSDPSMTNQIGMLLLGSSVQVIGIEFQEQFELSGEPKALVLTSSGQVGWVRNEVVSSAHQQVLTALEALDYDTLSDP